jgi:SAM-dependent methyltransferase
MRDQEATVDSSFGADAELERLASAERFIGWIADEIAPHLGRRVLEVGAGIGSVSLALAERRPDVALTVLEPAANLFDELQERLGGRAGITARKATSTELLDDNPAPTFDSVIYVNVLEHILDDERELRDAHQLLVAGGTLAIFVPALPRLYGSLDYKSGHHRRYVRGDLAATVEAAGFEVVELRYLDVLGVAPYYAMYRLIDVKSLGAVSSTGYDRVIVPVSRALQRLVPHPPLGKNLLAIARKR